ncbi:conserved oligomeric Golgi complex subunit 8-like [Gordionus sp. m RMFG-2023]|uniref:conserved oligomeric Golgi complex subunit 8-like n=1 Tax=Gordionus sp. m RMFG-2023 TaxID=3053472 RepID=UPI0031FC440B
MDNVNLTLSSILNDKSGLTLNDAFIKVEEDKHTVEEKLHNLIYTNYKVFLTSSQSSKDINEEFVIIKELSHNLSVSLPNYKEICNQFINVAKEINTRHKKAKLALIKYPKLIDFLEIPQLMDTCFKNGLYEETLHLHEFVKKMMQNLPHIQILNLVYNDSLCTYQSLIRGLSANLTSDSPTLAQAIERVGLLRAAGVFSEKAIRLLFLSRASRALRNDLKKLTRDHSEPLNYLFANRVCETLRIHLFETITQYSALFSLEEDSNSRSFTPTSFSQSDDTRAMSRKETYNRISNSWLAFELQNALTLIDYQTGLLFDKNRNLISESELGLAFRSLADQFDYFSMTMSKLNADCGHLLMQKLCEYATSYVSRMFDDVLRKFVSNLQQKSHYFCKLVPKEISARKTTLMPVLEKSGQNLVHHRSCMIQISPNPS